MEREEQISNNFLNKKLQGFLDLKDEYVPKIEAYKAELAQGD